MSAPGPRDPGDGPALADPRQDDLLDGCDKAMPFRKAPFGDVASPTLEAAVPDLATRAGLDDVDDRIRVDDGVPVRAGRLSSGWPSRSIAVARSALISSRAARSTSRAARSASSLAAASAAASADFF